MVEDGSLKGTVHSKWKIMASTTVKKCMLSNSFFLMVLGLPNDKSSSLHHSTSFLRVRSDRNSNCTVSQCCILLTVFSFTPKYIITSLLLMLFLSDFLPLGDLSPDTGLLQMLLKWLHSVVIICGTLWKLVPCQGLPTRHSLSAMCFCAWNCLSGDLLCESRSCDRTWSCRQLFLSSCWCCRNILHLYWPCRAQ